MSPLLWRHERARRIIILRQDSPAAIIGSSKDRSMHRHAVIRCAWDNEAEVWFVRESDIPGLATEAPSLEALRQRLPGMIQDLLDVDVSIDIEVDLIAYAHDRVRVEAA